MRPPISPSLHASLILDLESALRAEASLALAQSMQRYFPGGVVALGVSNAAVANIAAAAVLRAPALDVDEWALVADHFARSHACHEHVILASALLAKVARRADADGRLLELVKSWLENDVSNWAQCDDLCIKPLYLYLKRHPKWQMQVLDWAASPSPWCRRASNVAMVKFVGRSAHADLTRIFANCERLLADPDPYVQKGIGWLLKVTSQVEQQGTLAFLHQHRAAMARPTLRYAIEKLPDDLRRVFMLAP